ncbi:DUF2612 domain-containing protein [Alicyclobacillus dauci]|uniref:DUF2612 domain-containing protein n=1 Tax=Alicyclobacillus dauci TaxID=1475485 RepID=UPI0038994B7B
MLQGFSWTFGSGDGQLRDIGVALTSASSILDDDHYHLVLKAKIARNQWDGTIGQV